MRGGVGAEVADDGDGAADRAVRWVLVVIDGAREVLATAVRQGDFAMDGEAGKRFSSSDDGLIAISSDSNSSGYEDVQKGTLLGNGGSLCVDKIAKAAVEFTGLDV